MKKITQIKNVQVVTPEGIIWDGSVLVEDGIIVKIGKERTMETPVGAEVIDGKGKYLGPGFVDIHLHGGNGFDSCDQPVEAAEYFLAHGATSILASPAYQRNFDSYMEAFRSIKEGMKTAPNLKGIYAEGPYINPKYGAYAQYNPWKEDIPEHIFRQLVDEAGQAVKVWCIAPERPDLLPFLQYARAVNPGVVFALAHSCATPAEVRALGAYKPTIMTHCMNATGRKEVPPGTRGYGPDEYALKDPDMYTEVISDTLGAHVHAEIQQLILHAKGVHRVILITDSSNGYLEPPEEFRHADDLNFDDIGGLAGSRLTMDKACRNVMSATNCGIAQAFLMAATNPARAIGMGNEIGSVEVGKQADFVLVDDRFTVDRVILGGNVLF